MILNYYELLGVRYDADNDAIKAAYQVKILKADDNMTQLLNTAYMTLTDQKLRTKYDLSIGIHKYKKVPVALKAGKGFTRIILTLLDAFLTWFWCFLFVIIIAAGGYALYKYKVDGSFDYIYYLTKYKIIFIILGIISILDLIFHYYIRRINRKLKHYKWEIK